MAKKPVKAPSSFSVGDLVEIMRFGHGKIVALRGPLGPGGAQVYRVRYRPKPNAAYIEVLGNQIRPVKVAKRPKAIKGNLPPVADTTGGI